MVVGLFTGLLNHGGVERMGRQMAVVLASYAEDRGQSYRLFSLNDPVGTHEINVEGMLIAIHGFNRNKLLFVWTFTKLLFQVRLLLLAHPHLAPLAFLLRVMRSSIPCYVVTYGIDVWEPLSIWHRWALQLMTKVITISQYSLEKLIALQGVKAENISLLSPSVDKGFLVEASNLSNMGSDFSRNMTLLTVSRLSTTDSYKGIDVVLRALPQVLESVPHVQYSIVGDGDDRARLEGIAEEVGLRERVVFKGRVSDAELQNNYRNCDVFVMPSLNEGFGIVFLEAMAFSKPVVGGNHAGTIDVIHDGKNGCLVTYGDTDELSKCLIYLLTEEGIRNRLGKAGRHSVETQFSFARFKETFLLLLKEHAC
ncbi:MAG: hypothetical protein NPIRA01_04620 [Nitrospirales bacterium]|nr:MAG: hypothetical protein NPIRA01_04620 [Nitrospirales bacterium]